MSCSKNERWVIPVMFPGKQHLRYILPSVKTVKSWGIWRYGVWCEICQDFYSRNSKRLAKSFIKEQILKWLKKQFAQQLSWEQLSQFVEANLPLKPLYLE